MLYNWSDKSDSLLTHLPPPWLDMDPVATKVRPFLNMQNGKHSLTHSSYMDMLLLQNAVTTLQKKKI